MLFNVFITTCSVLFLTEKTSADSENDVKRGQYPYMAFLYYPHLIPKYGPIQDAIILKPEWLLSAALDPLGKEDKVEDTFPRKTLMARVGALEIDDKVTFNEDEDEQEREIIQVVRPKNHNPEKRWLTDVTLLKALLPFVVNAVVKVAPVYSGRKPEAERVCTILFYTNPDATNRTEKKVLTQHNVELLPAKKETCGNEFVSHNVMVCATDSSKNVAKFDGLKDSFCLINSGGPLICDDLVLGLQTYIKNTCTPPYLYQLISGWEESFINCGTSEKCSEVYCAKYCTVTYKDTEPIIITTKKTVKDDDFGVPEFSTEVYTESSVSIETILTARTEIKPTNTQAPPKTEEETPTVTTEFPTESVQKVARRNDDVKQEAPSASVLFLESEKDDRKIQVLNKTKVKLVSNAEGKYVSALMGLPIIIVNLIAAI